MSSSNEDDTPPINTLPPVLIANQRQKVLAEAIDCFELVDKKTQKDKPKEKDVLGSSAPTKVPSPLHPLALTWSPEQLIFEIKDDPVVLRLWVRNSCTRSIYVHCCDIWDDSAYLGARWCCYPQTRFLLAPGLKAEMFVRASPKDQAPVPFVKARLQLAAAHRRDHVVGYFAVPLSVRYLKYVPMVGEDGS